MRRAVLPVAHPVDAILASHGTHPGPAGIRAARLIDMTPELTRKALSVF
jgi:hypothetical protein